MNQMLITLKDTNVNPPVSVGRDNVPGNSSHHHEASAEIIELSVNISGDNVSFIDVKKNADVSKIRSIGNLNASSNQNVSLDTDTDELKAKTTTENELHMSQGNMSLNLSSPQVQVKQENDSRMEDFISQENDKISNTSTNLDVKPVIMKSEKI